jgi:hypothetical protein
MLSDCLGRHEPATTDINLSLVIWLPLGDDRVNDVASGKRRSMVAAKSRGSSMNLS